MSRNQAVNKMGLTEEEFLASYDPAKYDRPSVTVDMLIFTVTNEVSDNYRKLPEKALKLLMIKRGDHPCIGQWALPGGFVGMHESLEEAAYRELKEETGIENVYLEQLYTWGDPNRDPRTRIISTSYLSLTDSSVLDIKASDDADDARWFTVTYRVFKEEKTMDGDNTTCERYCRLTLHHENETLTAVLKQTLKTEGKLSRWETTIEDPGGIAFDHARIIAYGIERLRNKVEYTDIAFNLMPQYFTLTELQQVYEVILDRELLKANFRRKIADRVVETNRYKKDAGHRPSKLYMYRGILNAEDWERGSG
ncbi:MAG TPA: NUDIX domain-containing protein [Thermoclostridium caenicola]|nr:NUDIX domain-containing protein [Thermoclostridium caenicola]